MAPTRIQPAVPVKKRRTFFSSSLPFLPKIASASRPATTPSDRVLAALHEPTPRVPSPERAVRAKKVRNDEAVPEPIPRKEPTPPRTIRPTRNIAKPLPVTKSTTRKVPVIVATRRANATHRVNKAQTAQSTNSKLSAAMEMAMRSTISGRERPYMRDNTWTVMSVPKGKGKEVGGKEYMAAGFYCQDANAKSPHKLVSKVLKRHEVLNKVKGKGKDKGKQVDRPKRGVVAESSTSEQAFPPLPYDHGYDHFFGQEHEFVLPYNIQQEAESGSLDGKKKPMSFQKLRGNVFPERARVSAEHTAVCRCDPESRCEDNCINRIMSYLCGKECPCGDACENKSLARRKMPQTRVVHTGSRGFGLFAMEDIKAGDFVTDYRGEVISLNTFYDRIQDVYKGQKNFYALAYDQDEVVDAGMRGNDARFINHGCDPNLEVRKLQTLGDGMGEYEIGMWALQDIKSGEELFYDYNFENFGAGEDLRTVCRCGAPKCVGFLGRAANDKAQVPPEKAKKPPRKASRRSATKARSSLVIGYKAVDKSDDLESHPQAESELALDNLSTPRLHEEGEMEIDSPMTEIEEIPLATRFWRTEPAFAQEGQSRPARAPSPLQLVPTPIRLPPISRAPPSPAPQARSLIVTPSPMTIIPWDRPTPLQFMSPGAPLQHSGIDGHLSSATPSTPRPPFTMADVARSIVSSIDRSAERVIHPPQDNRVVSVENVSLTPFTPATPVAATDTTPRTAAEIEAARKAAKRKSGWANWLKKVAGEKQRTLEEWHEERIKRRRGIAWMRMMIEEFGLAPSASPPTAAAYSDGSKPAGSVMSFANTLAALGHPAGPAEVKRLGGPGNGKGKEKEKRKVSLEQKITPRVTPSQEAGPSYTSMDRSTPITPMPTSQVGTDFRTPNGSTKRSAEPSAQSQPNKRGRHSSVASAAAQVVDDQLPNASATTQIGVDHSAPPQAVPPVTFVPTAAPEVAAAPSEGSPAATESSTIPSNTEASVAAADAIAVSNPPTSPHSASGTPGQAIRTAAQVFDIAEVRTYPVVDAASGEPESAASLRARETAKRKAIAARNGAPMGWAFVDPTTKARSRLVSAVEADLPRSARKARVSLVREEAIENMSGRRLSAV